MKLGSQFCPKVPPQLPPQVDIDEIDHVALDSWLSRIKALSLCSIPSSSPMIKHNEKTLLLGSPSVAHIDFDF